MKCHDTDVWHGVVYLGILVVTSLGFRLCRVRLAAGGGGVLGFLQRCPPVHPGIWPRFDGTGLQDGDDTGVVGDASTTARAPLVWSDNMDTSHIKQCIIRTLRI